MQAVGNTFIKLSSITLLALSVNLVGCQTFKNLTGGKDVDAVETAEKSEQAYYNDAITQIDKGRYTQAIEDLTNLRTFYPTGQYAEQALLDMMYAQYESGKYEMAAASAEQFIRLYPSNPQVSYAYYVRGVANMQGSSEVLNCLSSIKPNVIQPTSVWPLPIFKSLSTNTQTAHIRQMLRSA